MRFEFQLLGDAMVARLHETHGPEDGFEIENLSRDLPLRHKTTPVGWRRSFGATMSVVKAHIIEGFASSAVALHPDMLFAPTALGHGYYRVDDMAATRSGEDRLGRHVESRLSVRRAAMQVPAAQPQKEGSAMNGLVRFEDVGPLEVTRDEFRSFQSRLLSGIAGLWSRMVVAYRNKRAFDELAALDDRMLKDIGISRQQIRGAVLHGRDQ